MLKSTVSTYICEVSHDLVSVTIWCLYDRSNACQCMLTLFSMFISFLSVCISQHGVLTGLSNFKRQNANQTGQERKHVTIKRRLNVASCNTFICNVAQCFHQFIMVFIYCLLSFLKNTDIFMFSFGWLKGIDSLTNVAYTANCSI